jgi:hypothetical protein
VAVTDIEVTVNTTKQLLNSKSNMEVEITDYFRESQQSRDEPSTEGPQESLTGGSPKLPRP